MDAVERPSRCWQSYNLRGRIKNLSKLFLDKTLGDLEGGWVYLASLDIVFYYAGALIMRVITFSEILSPNSRSVITASNETHEVVVSLTSSDYSHNYAHVHMSASQARRLAAELLIYADRIDPV